MGRRESPRKERERERERSGRELSSRKKSLSSRHSSSKSPVRDRSSTQTKSPTRRKSPLPDNRTRSPNRDVSESPSPRTKRLKRAKAEREVGRDMEHEVEKNDRRARHVEKDSDREVEKKRDRMEHEVEKNDRRARHVEKDSDKEVEKKRDRRSGRDEHDNGSGRERRGRGDSRGRDELRSPRDDDQQNGDNDSVAKMKAAEETLEAKDKQKPSFELSGKLAAETNRFRGVTLLFNEPPDARMPDIRWRLYVFKGGEPFNEPLYVHRQSCYLFGRERRVADIPTDHPSCSKQHAVLQYRQVEQENPDGSMSKRVRPYLMDLGSTNGTFINDDRIEAQRYYELFEKDNIKFGNSSREYVLLHENSAA